MNIIKLFTVLVIFAFSTVSHAEEIDGRTEPFTNLYLKLCMKNLNDFEALRTQLTNNKLPRFPPVQAALFLKGHRGDAWPVPYQGQQGNFVLALPSDKNFCAIHARRVNQAEVERQFIKLVSKAPPPLISELKNKEVSENSTNGMMRTISYAWSLPQAKRKMLFTLTTASSKNANLQALGSVAMIFE
ncbi:hypothetical protein ACFL4M_00415 [Pseudomonadota bacterium]